VHALGKVVSHVPAVLNDRVGNSGTVSMVFGTINAGIAANAIPSVGTASATVRSYGSDLDTLPGLVEEIVRLAIADTGAEATIDYARGVPPVVNDIPATRLLQAAAARALGERHVVQAELSMGAEDFSFYLQRVPGAMFRLGVRRPGQKQIVDIHHPGFDVDESAIGVGALVFVRTVLAALARQSV
jgi:metal-dependent amidase/aminoacylase/carboxypeptidase family protein